MGAAYARLLCLTIIDRTVLKAQRHLSLSIMYLLLLLVVAGLLTACSPPTTATSVITVPARTTQVAPSATTAVSTATRLPPETSPTISPTTVPQTTQADRTATPAPSVTPTPSPTSDMRLDPAHWREWPSIPTVSARAYEIYQQGLAEGNDAQAFSRLGDCESAPEAFLGFYVEEWAWLPEEYEYLQDAIDHFHASFARDNLTARDGFGVSSVLSPLMADPNFCNNNETPLECEYRLHKPSLIFISMGTNWAPYAGSSYEEYLRQVVEFAIDHGVLPILMTKADNIELDNSINAAIAWVAYDFDIPLLNFWRIAHDLPHNGLEEDGAHLTTQAEDSRNFHGLITLYTVWDQTSNWEQP